MTERLAHHDEQVCSALRCLLVLPWQCQARTVQFWRATCAAWQSSTFMYCMLGTMSQRSVVVGHASRVALRDTASFLRVALFNQEHTAGAQNIYIHHRQAMMLVAPEVNHTCVTDNSKGTPYSC